MDLGYREALAERDALRELVATGRRRFGPEMDRLEMSERAAGAYVRALIAQGEIDLRAPRQEPDTLRPEHTTDRQRATTR
jgi:hypothetical protein